MGNILVSQHELTVLLQQQYAHEMYLYEQLYEELKSPQPYGQAGGWGREQYNHDLKYVT